MSSKKYGRLSRAARAAIERTKRARRAIDRRLEGYVDDNPTPSMVYIGPRRRQTRRWK